MLLEFSLKFSLILEFISLQKMSFRGRGGGGGGSRGFGSFGRGGRRGNRGGSNRSGGYDQGPPEQVTGK